MNGSGLEKKKKRRVRTRSRRWASPPVVFIKRKKGGKKKRNHTTSLQGPQRREENRALLQWSPIVLPTKTTHIRCLQTHSSSPRPAACPPLERIAESLHRKIQIVSRAVSLLEHKLRGEALLSVSNILSIIHRGGGGRLKGVGWG